MTDPLFIDELSHVKPHRQTGDSPIQKISVSRKKRRSGSRKRDSGRVVGNSEAIRRLGSRKLILCWRFGAAEGAARGSVSAFQGRRATGGSSLEAGQPQLQQRLLGRHRGGERLSGAAKRYPLGCRAGNGGRKQQPGSILAERSFPARARRARQIPSVRALRRMRRNGSNVGLHVSLFGSNRVTCHLALLS